MKKWLNITTGVTSIAVLALNLALLQNVVREAEEISAEAVIEGTVLRMNTMNSVLLLLLFLVVAVSRAIRALLCRQEKTLYIRHLVYAVLTFGSVMVLLIRGNNLRSWWIAGVLYLIAVWINMIIWAAGRKKKRYFLFPVLFFLLSVFLGLVPAVSFIESLFVLDIQAIAEVFPLAFARIRMDILKRIIRKTYAAEILLGIVLLIIAISLMLPLFEDGITTFPDALWYCFAIVTTIGFGDMYATSVVGRIMSVILGIYGIIVVALITSVIVNFYGELSREEGNGDDEKEGKEKKAEAPQNQDPG